MQFNWKFKPSGQLVTGCTKMSMDMHPYIACMMQHSVRVVPATDNDGFRNTVLSGSCLDHTVMDANMSSESETRVDPNDSHQLLLFTEPDGYGYDFLLT